MNYLMQLLDTEPTWKLARGHRALLQLLGPQNVIVDSLRLVLAARRRQEREVRKQKTAA